MTTEELNALIVQAESGDVSAMNQLTHIYGEEDGFINYEQAARWFFELIKRDCEAERPQTGGMMAPPPPPGMSRVYENTGYNKGLYEKIKNAILNSKTEEEIMASLTGDSSGGSLLGGACSITTSDAKNYINLSEEAIQRNIEYKERQRREAEEKARKEAEEEERRRKEEERRREEEEKARKEADEAARKKAEAEIMLQKIIEEDVEDEYRINKYGYEEKCNISKLSSFIEGNGKLVVPNGTKRIGKNAFYNCKQLKSIEFPNSISGIGAGAFENCENLTFVTISNNNTTSPSTLSNSSSTIIGDRAFFSCSNLISITIPNLVKKIGDHAFCYCRSLTSIKIPNSVTSIGYGAFSGCKSLTSINIPNSVKSIGAFAFEECSSLTSVTIPDGVTNIGSSAFEECSSLISITFENISVCVGFLLFKNCHNLKDVIIPYGAFDLENCLSSERGLPRGVHPKMV